MKAKKHQSAVIIQIDEAHVEQETAISLKQRFEPFEIQAMEWKDKAESLVVSDESQVEEMKQAREARLALKNIRVAVEKTHKELKADALKKGQLLDSIKRTLTALITPIEDHLEKQEKYCEIKEAEFKKNLYTSRLEQLLPFMGDSAREIHLGDMSEDVFQNLLVGQKYAFEQKQKEAERLEKERAEREAAERKEQERIKKENERLKLERDKQEIKLKKEREERLRLEREQKEREEKEEAERKAKQLAERRMKRAPDKEKLLNLANDLSKFQLPTLRDDEAQDIISNVHVLIEKTVKYIRDKAEKL